MFCLDNHRTFFTVSLDGVSAFDVVSRDIQLRELFCAGEDGRFWLASHFEYKNSLTKIKRNQEISDALIESQGVKQGSCKSSDHYKIYLNPALDLIENASLGVQIGPINSGMSACADDIQGMSDDQNKLQCILDLAEHYGRTYRVTYGADKTKITISGPQCDIDYYKEIKPWRIYGETVSVVSENEHLGQIVSDNKQKFKNVENRIIKARKSLFSILGSGFSYRSHLSPSLKIHAFRTLICPILRSGHFL